jgi:uncharacterized protein (DUF433 family)
MVKGPPAGGPEISYDGLAMSAPYATEIIPLGEDSTGTLRVGNTRVILDLVVYAFQTGRTPEDIVQSYTTLTLADVYLVIGYYLRHQAEVDAYIEKRDREAEEIRREIEARQGSQEGIREMLLARRKQQSC